MHLARLHQKQSSLAAAAASSQTQSTQTATDTTTNISTAASAPSAAVATARPNNAPLTGNYSIIFHCNQYSHGGRLIVISV